MGYRMRSEFNTTFLQFSNLRPSHAIVVFKWNGGIGNISRWQEHCRGKAEAMQDRKGLSVKIGKSVVKCNYYYLVVCSVGWFAETSYCFSQSASPIATKMKESHLKRKILG
jgi:hypothetical protein